MHYPLIACLFVCYVLAGCENTSYASGRRLGPDKALNETVDSIVVIKSLRQMRLYHRGSLLREYRVCLGPNPLGPKHFRNDGKTPEGLYHINGKNPNSHYHKALAVSYPSPEDTRYARRFGKPAGGDIKIHGLPNAYSDDPVNPVTDDWTLGCIALSNAQIDELYLHVSVGAWVNILP